MNSSSSSLTTPGSASPCSCPAVLGLSPTLNSSSSQISSSLFLLRLLPLTLLPMDLASFFRPLRFSRLPMLSKLPPKDCAADDSCPNELLCRSFFVRSVRLPARTMNPIRTSSLPRSFVFSFPGLPVSSYLLIEKKKKRNSESRLRTFLRK